MLDLGGQEMDPRREGGMALDHELDPRQHQRRSEIESVYGVAESGGQIQQRAVSQQVDGPPLDSDLLVAGRTSRVGYRRRAEVSISRLEWPAFARKKTSGHASRKRDVAPQPGQFCFSFSRSRRVFNACHRGRESSEDWLCVRVAEKSSCSTR